MYIISKNRDYYDSAVGMGIDKSIVYERHLNSMLIPKDVHEVLDEDQGKWHSAAGFTTSYGGDIPKGKFNSHLIVVGFCGKLHIGIKFTKQLYGQGIINDTYETEIIYDHDKILKRLKAEDETKRGKYSWERPYRVENFNNYVTRINAFNVDKWFRRFNTPIFVYGTPLDISRWRYEDKIDGCNFFINPVLKDYQFAKVVDPYTAFQEIYMYIGGVLGANKDGTEIPATEKQKVAQHGMNKWSFRKPPSK